MQRPPSTSMQTPVIMLGLVRTQVERRIRKVLGCGEPAQRYRREELCAHLGRVLAHEALEQRRFPGHRVQRIDADAGRGQLDRHRAGRRDHPPLRGVVPVQPRARRNARRRGDVEDTARASAFQVRHECAGGQVDRLAVHRENAVELVFADLFHGLRQVGDAGVVHQDVDAAHALDREVDHAVHAVAVRDIDLHRDAAGLLRHGLGALAVDVGQEDPRALAQEAARDTGAKARPRAGHDRDLALEPHLFLRSRCSARHAPVRQACPHSNACASRICTRWRGRRRGRRGHG